MPVELFISHCSNDVADLVEPLSELLREALYSGNDAAFAEHVFFTGRHEQGLRSGEHFDRMLEQLGQSRAVLAVVTRRTESSMAMVAEMSVARAQGKLLPAVGHPSYRRLLRWPLDNAQAPALGGPDGIRQLLGDLSRRLGRPLRTGEEIERRIAAVAQTFWRRCWPRVPNIPFRLALASFALIGVIAYVAGYHTSGPEIRYLTVSSDVVVGNHQLRLLFNGTLPVALLSNRLVDIQKSVPDAQTATVRMAFVEALRASAAWPGIPEKQRKDLEAIVGQWQSGDSRIASRGGRACEQLPVELDQRWCVAIQKAVNDDFRVAFDRDRFALVEINGQPKALMSNRPVPGLSAWMVRDVGAVVLLRQP